MTLPIAHEEWRALDVYNGHRIVGTPNEDVCGVFGGDDSVADDVRDARARLIAAAPRLYQALDAMLEHISVPPELRDATWAMRGQQIAFAADEVLRVARGEVL